MDPREIDPGKWAGEMSPEKLTGKAARRPRGNGFPAQTGPGKYPALPRSGRAIALLAIALGVAACGEAPPREQTEAEKICATQGDIACAEAKQAEQRRMEAAKQLEAAGMFDNR